MVQSKNPKFRQTWVDANQHSSGIYHFGENPRAATEGAESLARQVADRTNGAWEIRLHYGEALSKSRENLDGLAINAFEGAMFCNIYHPRKSPALMVLALPFLPMTDWNDNRNVRDAIYAQPIIIEEARKWNAMLYVSSFLPSNEIMGRGEPPRTFADWEGKTVRAGGGMGKALKYLGATPTSSTATEVYTGVQQGTMDAAAFPFTYAHCRIPDPRGRRLVYEQHAHRNIGFAQLLFPLTRTRVYRTTTSCYFLK